MSFSKIVFIKCRSLEYDGGTIDGYFDILKPIIPLYFLVEQHEFRQHPYDPLLDTERIPLNYVAFQNEDGAQTNTVDYVLFNASTFYEHNPSMIGKVDFDSKHSLRIGEYSFSTITQLVAIYNVFLVGLEDLD